jgi:tetratricopeptide (TPR) repeat protein/serine/threonine protein kinase
MTAEEILQAAVEIKTATERAAWLNAACAGNAELRAFVDGLLEAHEAAGSFLEQALFDNAEEVGASPGAESVGTVIGPYQLLQQIGEGGMGTVWMAQQIEPIRRHVAIKVVKEGMDSRQVLSRFEAERQALALMDHPNIARVLDADRTPSGRPYFVMELVHGKPLTGYCDENRLGVRERLALFGNVCSAVQHAHQKGIIHRDIKPSNVLAASYDGKAVVKVIDFGVAKATGQRLTDKTLVTGFGALVGTPEYMSPEQAEINNQDIDTRSDIYALGVLLYELLTGSPPFSRKELEKAGMLEMLRVIREQEPSKPSTRMKDEAGRMRDETRRSTPSRRLWPLTSSLILHPSSFQELDWIVMKALEKDRNRRYDTADALAMDVQRYLHDEPVLACPPSAAYRLRKFARRNRGTLTLVTGLLLAMTVTAVSVGWALRDRAARAAETRQAELVRRTELEAQVRESLIMARALLDENKVTAARQRLVDARARLGSNVAALSNLRAEVEAGERSLDRFQQFLDLIQRAHEAEMAPVLQARSSSISFTGLGMAPPARTGDRWPSAAVPLLLEAVRCYGVLEQNDWDNALDAGFLGKQQIERIRRHIYEELLWLADDLMRRQLGHQGEGKLSVSEAARQALVYIGDAERAHSPTPALLALRALCHEALGEAAAAEADTQRAATTPPTLAVDHYLRGQRAVDARLRREGVEAFEAALRLEPTHYWSMMQLGYCLCDLGRGPEDFLGAARVFTGCMLKQPDHAHAYYCRANAYSRLRRYEEAIADGTRAIDLDPTSPLAWNNRGATYNELGQRDKAVADFTRAIELHPKFALALHNRGATYCWLSQLDKAIADLSQVIELDPEHGPAWNDRGVGHYEAGQLDQAVADFSRASDLNPKLALVWHNRGAIYDKLGRPDKAVADYTRAIDLDPTFAKTWYNRGVVYDGQNDLPRALADLSHAIKLDPDLARAWYNRGVVYNKMGQTATAISDYTEAIARDPTHVPAWNNRGLAYSKLGQADKAIADLSQAIKLDPKHVSAWCGRGWVYNQADQLDKAISDFTTAIELGPNLSQVVSVYLLRAQANGRLGHFEEARADYEAALQREPDHATASLALAWLLATCPDAKVRDPNQAVARARKAVQLAPKRADRWNTLGVAYYRAGDWKAAVDALDKSVELRPGADAFDGLFLAMAHRKLGNHDAAHRSYEQVLHWLKFNQKALASDRVQAEELRRFRAEAEEVLGLTKQ